jgi:thymidylate kinase
VGATSDPAVERRARRVPASRTAPPVHPGLRAIFAGFDAAAVSWCVLRGELDLESPRGDTDLLVSATDLEAARRVLVEAGWVEERAWGLKPHRAFLGFDVGTGTWLKLDIVTECAFGAHSELRLPGAEVILARRRRSGGVWVPESSDAFWLLLLHALLDKDGVAEKYRPRLATLAPAALAVASREHDPASFVDRLRGQGWTAETIAGAAARGEWTALYQAGAALRSAWAGRERIRSRAVVAWRAFARRAGWRIGLVPSGLTVAILGPDGAGKSTLIEAMSGAFPVPSRAIYMGLYKRKIRLPGIGLLARTLLQRLRYLLGRYHRARGRIVLFDRYTFDALVQEHAAPGWKKRIHTWLLAHAAPPPDLTLVLDLPGDTMHARKGERDPDTLERMRAGYRAIAERPGSAALDATAPAEHVARTATGLIWTALARGQRG